MRARHAGARLGVARNTSRHYLATIMHLCARSAAAFSFALAALEFRKARRITAKFSARGNGRAGVCATRGSTHNAPSNVLLRRGRGEERFEHAAQLVGAEHGKRRAYTLLRGVSAASAAARRRGGRGRHAAPQWHAAAASRRSKVSAKRVKSQTHKFKTPAKTEGTRLPALADCDATPRRLTAVGSISTALRRHMVSTSLFASNANSAVVMSSSSW